MAETTIEKADSKKIFQQGVRVCAADSDFSEAVKAAVDYRGDVTIELKRGGIIEGFLYNLSAKALDLFPKDSPQKKSIAMDDVNCLEFSGKDEAKGKSWEDWMKKRDQTKADSAPVQ